MYSIKQFSFLLLLVFLQGCLHNNFKRTVWTDPSLPSSIPSDTRISINGIQRVGISDSVDHNNNPVVNSDSLDYNLKTRTVEVAKMVDEQIDTRLLGFVKAGPFPKSCFVGTASQTLAQDQPPISDISVECQQKAVDQNIRYILYVPWLFGYHQQMNQYYGIHLIRQFTAPGVGTQLALWDVKQKKYVQSIFLNGYFWSDSVQRKELTREYAAALVEPLPITNGSDALDADQRTAEHRALEVLVHFEMLAPLGGDINRDLEGLNPTLLGPSFSLRYIHSRWGVEALVGYSIAKSERYPEEQFGLDPRFQFNAMYYFFQVKPGRFGFYGGATYATIKTYDVYASFMEYVGLPDEASAFGFQGGLTMDALLENTGLVWHFKMGWQNLSGDFERTNLDIQGVQFSTALGWRIKLLQ